MTEPTVQVPVSLPTRELIAKVLAGADPFEEAWDAISDESMSHYLRQADAVLALLSQPRPVPPAEAKPGAYAEYAIDPSTIRDKTPSAGA